MSQDQNCECGAPLPGSMGRPGISTYSCKCGTVHLLAWAQIDPVTDRMITLISAKDDVRQALLEGGSRCPCCDRLAQAQKRRIHKDMAFFLIELLKATTDRKACTRGANCSHMHGDDGVEWVHVRELGRGIGKGSKASSDGSYLKLWGMVEAKPVSKGEPSSGYYCITDHGIDFALGRVKVPAWAMVYNNTAIQFSSHEASIQESLDAFNYEEVIGYQRTCDKCKVQGYRTCGKCGANLRDQDAKKAEAR